MAVKMLSLQYPHMPGSCFLHSPSTTPRTSNEEKATRIAWVDMGTSVERRASSSCVDQASAC